MNRSTKKSIILLTFILTLFLSGCSVRYGTESIILGSGKGEFSFIITIDEDLHDAILSNRIDMTLDVSTFEETQNNGKKSYIHRETTEFASLDEFTAILTMPYESDYISQLIDASKSILPSSEQYALKNPLFRTVDIGDGHFYGTVNDESILVSKKEITGVNVASYVQITFPDKVKLTNGKVLEDGCTVLWEGAVVGGTLTAELEEASSIGALALVCAVLIAVIIVAVTFIIIKRKKTIKAAQNEEIEFIDLDE